MEPKASGHYARQILDGQTFYHVGLAESSNGAGKDIQRRGTINLPQVRILPIVKHVPQMRLRTLLAHYDARFRAPVGVILWMRFGAGVKASKDHMPLQPKASTAPMTPKSQYIDSGAEYLILRCSYNTTGLMHFDEQSLKPRRTRDWKSELLSPSEDSESYASGRQMTPHGHLLNERSLPLHIADAKCLDWGGGAYNKNPETWLNFGLLGDRRSTQLATLQCPGSRGDDDHCEFASMDAYPVAKHHASDSPEWAFL
ncbi:hypothetical protein C8F04DRAFT_1335193 [Mycena alexandri]|uniref:Uncharacterized protein n=1 Tax=Mycena alexandri TaxID=1745969 RepID=A0AAD6TLE2_9AGAR|nr:hypothetical protein C8F04DRAFT_1335193 [Mycena alexandri]